MSSKEEALRNRIVSEHITNSLLSHRNIAKKLNIAKSTVSSVLKRFKEKLTTARKPGTGKNRGPVSVKKDKKVIEMFKRNPNLSVRCIAKKINMSAAYVQKVKTRTGLKAFKVQKAPNRNEKQNVTAKTRARKLYETVLTKHDCIVMDDETYVIADFKQIPGQEYYTSIDKISVPDKFKKQKVSKFPKKFLVWQAICSCGRRSQSFVSTGTINQEIYVKECLNKRLLPFLRNHGVSVAFWPDLASCHYAKTAMEWYKNNNVAVVPKSCNPPNSPELRPIEKFWALVKRQLKYSKNEAKDINDFKRKWRLAGNSITEDTVQNLMMGVKKKVREFSHLASEN